MTEKSHDTAWREISLSLMKGKFITLGDVRGISITVKKGEDINSIFQILSYALRSRYRISIDPGSTPPAERDLKVRVVSRNPVLRKLHMAASYRLEK